MAAQRSSPVDQYARDVVAGKVPAGGLVMLACRRHLADRKRKDITFDVEAAARVVKFFSLLHHSKGQWAGQPFLLSPWQAFLVGSLMGWKRKDGTRRFRVAYNEVPRKNGKSTLSAGIALFLAFFDGEPGAEVYCAATKRDQAKIVFDEAMRMVKASPELKRLLTCFVGNIHNQAKAQKLQPLGADADTMDGLHIHAAIVDEVHAHKSRAIVDVLETATGARRQPLLFYITTAGYDRESVCWQQHEYSRQVLEGTVKDDSWFAFIAAADPEDDWRKPMTWRKANPNLGVSVHEDDLARKCAKAEAMPAAQNAFRRLHLDEWTEQADRWMDLAVWDKGAVPVEVEPGSDCWAGLDLASTQDITAFVQVFPDDSGAFDVQARFWVPEEGVQKRGDMFAAWSRDGFIETTPGNVTDYAHIREAIREACEAYSVREIAYDRWNATQLVTQLQDDGATMVPYGQGFASMSAPVRELERLILNGKLRHGGNPVLRWMMSNVAVRQDPAGNVKFDKDRSADKIDGMVALAMAMGRAVVSGGSGGSVYDERGLVVI